MGPSRQNRQQIPGHEQPPPAPNQKALYQAIIKSRKQGPPQRGVAPLLIHREPHVIITEARIVVRQAMHPQVIHDQHKISSIRQEADNVVVVEIMDNALITHILALAHIIRATQRDRASSAP